VCQCAYHCHGMAKSAFSAQCPWTFEEAMDADFWPDV